MQGDNKLSKISHILIDEVHERAADTDMLLLFIRRLVKVRKDLKVILMSATLDAEKFQNYFNEFKLDCPAIAVPGRTFPVKKYFLEDAVEMCEYYCDDDSEYKKKGDITFNHEKMNLKQLGGKKEQVDLTWGHEEHFGKLYLKCAC